MSRRVLPFLLCILGCQAPDDSAGSIDPDPLGPPSAPVPSDDSIPLTTPRPDEVGDRAPTIVRPSGVCDASPATTVLATVPEHGLTDIFVDASGVYFSGGRSVPGDGSPGSDTEGIVSRVAREGGPVANLWTGQGIAYSVSANDTAIFLLSYDYASAGRTGFLRTLPKLGGPAQSIGTWKSHGSSMSLAIAGNDVFWTVSLGSGGAVRRTTGSTTVDLANDNTSPGKVVSRESSVFWLSSTSLREADATSPGSSSVVWQSPTPPQALAASPFTRTLFVSVDDEILGVDPGTHVVTRLADNQAGTGDMAADESFLYWTNVKSGRVNKLAVGGTETQPVVLAEGQTPVALAVDDTCVYWVDQGTRSVMRARK